jgi:hypothetical protein
LAPARQVLNGLKALRAVHGEGHVVRHGRQQLDVGAGEAIRLARHDVQDAEDALLRAQGHRDQ